MPFAAAHNEPRPQNPIARTKGPRTRGRSLSDCQRLPAKGAEERCKGPRHFRKSRVSFMQRAIAEGNAYAQFIHGGGFALGTTSTMDAGRQLISRAVSEGVSAPLVYVSANYRVNGTRMLLSFSASQLLHHAHSRLLYFLAFGFLAGEEVAAEGGLNAGLLDRASL